MNEYDAKNLPFTQSGAGVGNYGWTPQNVWDNISGLRTNQHEKAGGQKELWENLSRWTDTPQVAHLHPDQKAAWDQFIKTGQRPAGLTDQTAMLASDWALRDVDRGQQHKPTSIWDTVLTDILPEIALGLVPGVGPALAAAYGGIKGGVESGSVLSGLLGAAGGYGTGSLGAGLAGAGSAAGGWEGFIDDPMQWAGNVGHNAWTSAGNAVTDVGNFLEHPIQGMENWWTGGTPGAGALPGTGGGGAPAVAGNAPPGAGLPGYNPGLPAGGGATPITTSGAASIPGVGVGGGGGGLTGAPGGLDFGGTDLAGAGAGAASGVTDVPVIAPNAAAGAGAAAKGVGTGAMNVLNKFGLSPQNLPSLGLQAYGAFKGPQTSTAEKTLANQAAPYNAEAKQLMDFYNSGNLHPSDEQAITQYQQQEQARVNDYWSRAGAPQSSGRIQMLQDIEKKTQAMRDQTRQGYLISAIQAGGLGTQATQTLAQIQALDDREASQALDTFLNSIASGNASGRYNPTAPTVPHV